MNTQDSVPRQRTCIAPDRWVRHIHRMMMIPAGATASLSQCLAVRGHELSVSARSTWDERAPEWCRPWPAVARAIAGLDTRSCTSRRVHAAAPDHEPQPGHRVTAPATSIARHLRRRGDEPEIVAKASTATWDRPVRDGPPAEAVNVAGGKTPRMPAQRGPLAPLRAPSQASRVVTVDTTDVGDDLDTCELAAESGTRRSVRISRAGRREEPAVTCFATAITHNRRIARWRSVLGRTQVVVASTSSGL